MDLFTLVGTISVKYTDAVKQIEEVNKTSRIASSSLDEIEDSAGDADHAFSDLGDSAEDADDAIYDIREDGIHVVKQMDKLSKSTKEAEEDVDQLGKTTKDSRAPMQEYGDETQKTGEKTKETGEKTEEASGKFDKWGVILANLATNIIQNVIDKCTDLAKKVVDLGKDFTATMSEVQAISGASNEDLQMLEETARKFGATTQFSATDAAEALKYMSLAGWTAEESASALGGVLDLAAASGMGLADASDMVTDYLSAFGKEASDSAYFADMLAYAQANSNTTASMLGEAYKNCAANLNAAGQDMETVTSMLEAMANQGLKGSEAGTAVAATMRDITNHMFEIKDATELATYEQNGFVSSTGDLNDVLGKNAITVGNTIVPVADAAGNFRDLTDILRDVESATNGMGDSQRAAAMSSTFTVYSIKGMNLMMNEGIDTIAGYEEELRKCSGTATDMAKTMNDNLKGDLASMNSAWEELGLKVFDTIERPLRVMVQAVTGSLLPALTAVLQGRNGAENILSSALQTLVTKLGVHLNNIAGQLTNVISVIVSGILKSLPALIPVVTKIFTTIADTLAQNIPMILDAISDFIQKFAERFASNLPVIIAVALNLINALAEGLLQAIPELLAILPDLVRNIADGILQSIDMIVATGVTLLVALIDAMPEIISGIVKVIPVLIDGIVSVLPILITAIVSVLPVLIEGIVGGLLGLLPDLIQAGITLFLALVNALPEIIQAITEVIPDIVTAVVSAILDNLPAIIDAGFQLFSALIGALPDIIATVVGVVPDIVGGIMGVLPEIEGKFSEFLQNIGNLAPIIMGVVTAFMTFKGILGVMAGVQKAITFFSGIPALLAKAGGAVSKLFAVVAANPTVAIIAAIVGVIAVLVTLWNTNEDFRNAVLSILDSIKTAVQNAWNFFVGYGEYLYDWLNGIVSAVSGFFSGIWNFFTGYGEYLYDWIHGIFDTVGNVLNAIVSTVQNIWNAITNAVQVGILFVASLLDAAFQIITLPFRFIWENCKEYVISAWESIKNAVTSAVDAVSAVITTIFTAIRNFFVTVWNAVYTFIADTLKRILDRITSIFTAVRNTVETIFNAIQNFLLDIWNFYSDIITTALENIKNGIIVVLTAIRDFFVSIWNAISRFVKSVLNDMHKRISNILNTIKTVFTNIWNAISEKVKSVVSAVRDTVRTGFETVKNTISEKLTNAKNIVVNIFDNIRNSISDKIESAKNIVKNGIDRIKNFFNFSWSLPHLKLPHFNISGEFSLDPPSVPTFGIDWYAKGGIMTEPTVFGFNPVTGNAQVGGEAGAEAIAPIDMLLGYVRTAVQEENQALAQQVESIIVLLTSFFPALLQRIPKEVVLDTGAVVGELTPAINEELGNISEDDERRRL